MILPYTGAGGNPSSLPGLGSYIVDSFVNTFTHHLSEFVDGGYFEHLVS